MNENTINSLDSERNEKYIRFTINLTEKKIVLRSSQEKK